MGTTTALRQLLKSLCHNTQWKYAILWKLKHMQLVWEDGYLNNEKSGGFLNGELGIISFGCETNTQNISPVEWPIGLAMARMSCCSYQLGQGIIGKVASTRNHHWTFAEEVNSIVLEEFPEEWKQQFIAGIKTILLVPVIPLGVVQLGSLDMVIENLREVVRIREYFSTFLNTSEISSSLWMDQLDCSTPFTMPSPFIVQNDLHVAVDMIDEPTWESTFSNMLANQMEETPVDFSVLTDNITMGNMSTFSFLEEELNVVSSMKHCLVSRQPILSTSSMKDYKQRTHDHGFIMESDEETNSIIDHGYLNFPSNSELHKALGQSAEGYDDSIWNTILSKANEWTSSVHEVYSPKLEAENSWFTNGKGTEQLLDDVIAELLNTSNDNESSESRCTRSCSNSSGKCSQSCLTDCKNEDFTVRLEETVLRSHKRSIIASDNEDSMNSSKSSNKNTISMSLNPRAKALSCGLYKRVPKSKEVSKKRGDTGDARRPKPRDRQLIQDRIKELRDLIPNSSKCSIDALLDLTIKHMSFLQSVPAHAEKLRQLAHPKARVEDQDHQNGASWVYEVGGQQRQCPLIVENHDQPDQLLIEMQCKEYGFFLEIAQVIKHLKLAILKGILDTKSDQLWAHFIVETPKGFHRMDILWPLVQLLQRNNNTPIFSY